MIKLIFVGLVFLLLLPLVMANPTPYGYEKLDNGKVIHAWNPDLDYYWNATSGLQFTNHYNDYWTKNTFCLGWKTTSWNYKCNNNLLSFNWNLETDNLTYFRATGHKDTTIGGKSIRIALRYELNESFNDLVVTPYVENRGSSDISNDIRFIWKTSDIQVGMIQENNSLLVDWKFYRNLSDPINEIFTNANLTHGSYFVEQPDTFEWFGLKWDNNLDYKLLVKSESGQYNAPITLILETTGLNAGQNKTTNLLWKDAVCSGTFGTNSIVEASGTGYSNGTIVSISYPPNEVGDGYADYLRFRDELTTIERLTCYQNGISCPVPEVEGICGNQHGQGYLECTIQIRRSPDVPINFQQTNTSWGHHIKWTKVAATTRVFNPNTEHFSSLNGFNCDEEYLEFGDFAELNNYNLSHDNFTDIRCNVRIRIYNNPGAPVSPSCKNTYKGSDLLNNWWANNNTPITGNVSINDSAPEILTCNLDFFDLDGDPLNITETIFKWYLKGTSLILNTTQNITNNGDYVCCVSGIDNVFETGAEEEVCSGDFNKSWQFAVIGSVFFSGLLFIYTGRKLDEKHYPIKILLGLTGLLIFLATIGLVMAISGLDLAGIFVGYLWAVFTIIVLILLSFISKIKNVYK